MRKSLWLIQHQLDNKACIGINPLYSCPEGSHLGRFDGLIQIFPHGMPCLDCIN